MAKFPPQSDTSFFSDNESAYQAPNGGLGGGAKLIDFGRIMAVLRKWWWLIFLIVTFFTSVAFLWVAQITPMYRAKATLEVKQQERNIVEYSEVDAIDADREFLITQIELLRSKNLAEDVAETLNLASDADFLPDNQEVVAGLSREARLASVTSRLRGGLTVSQVGFSRLIDVRFVHPNPRKAALVANTFTERFIEVALSRKFNSTVYAREFLSERLDASRRSLEKLERDLVEYSANNDLISLSGNEQSASTSFLESSQLIDATTQLATARSKRIEAQIAYQNSRNQDFVSEYFSNPILTGLKTRRSTLQSEYLEKLGLYKENFPQMLELQARIDSLTLEIDTEIQSFIRSRRSDIKSVYDQARSRESELSSRVQALKLSVSSIREKSIQYDILKRQLATERTQYEALLQRIGEVSVSEGVTSSLVQIVGFAEPPRSAFSPKKRRILTLAAMSSFLLALGLAFLIEFIDDRVRGPEDVKSKLGLILMGLIPFLSDEKVVVDALADPQSPIAEAYASLRANLQFYGGDGGPRVILLTSTRSGEGKSVSSYGVAARYAGVGHRVLLIDADLRRPSFRRGAEGAMGLSGLLASDAKLMDNILKTRFDGLSLLPAGAIAPNPSELLSGRRIDEIIKEARDNFDYVIIDSAPVLGLADAPTLGAKVDGTLIVIESGGLRPENVRQTVARLQATKTRILGAILTRYEAPTSGYSDYYQYSYGDKSRDYTAGKAPSRRKSKSEDEKENAYDRNINLF